MVRLHGSWGHYVRPGKTDPFYHGSAYVYGSTDSQSQAKPTKKKKRKKKKTAVTAKQKKHDVRAKPVSAGMYVILDVNGKAIYQCGKYKLDRLRPRLHELLLRGCYRFSARGIRLNTELIVLGYQNNQDFAHRCSELVKGPSA